MIYHLQPYQAVGQLMPMRLKWRDISNVDLTKAFRDKVSAKLLMMVSSTERRLRTLDSPAENRNAKKRRANNDRDNSNSNIEIDIYKRHKEKKDIYILYIILFTTIVTKNTRYRTNDVTIKKKNKHETEI
jgi:hypothetical protein